MRKFESLGQYHDHWAFVLLSAPDRFHDLYGHGLVQDQHGALREAFDDLREGFSFAEKKLKDDRLTKIARELIEMSFESYVAGDSKKAAHSLQECEGMIWPGSRLRVKHAVEAERRAFGEIVTYAGVRISPYPYEGTCADLGEDQAALLQLALSYCRSYQKERRDFKNFSWVIENDGAVKRTSADPKEDTHPILQPVQRSWGHKRLKELGQSGQIRACVLMSVVGAQGDLGVATYDLEQRGRPRVSARQLFTRADGAFQYEDMRFHLEDPQFFPEPTPPAPD
jgi:hypothetical protein